MSFFSPVVFVISCSGDVDGVVPITGTRAWLQQLEDEGRLVLSNKWAPWYLDNQVGHTFPTLYGCTGVEVLCVESNRIRMVIFVWCRHNLIEKLRLRDLE